MQRYDCFLNLQTFCRFFLNFFFVIFIEFLIFLLNQQKDFDGLFVGQNIYLEDKLLNVIYDLRTTPYSFTATEGIVENRFVIRYTNTVF